MLGAARWELHSQRATGSETRLAERLAPAPPLAVVPLLFPIARPFWERGMGRCWPGPFPPPLHLPGPIWCQSHPEATSARGTPCSGTATADPRLRAWSPGARAHPCARRIPAMPSDAGTGAAGAASTVIGTAGDECHC